MAFLDNSGDIILDAVLTDTGRFRLAKGDGTFKIAKFAFADDEIDYGTYNKTHASGSAYYDLDILQTPVLEAFTNNTSLMKSKLLSISRANLLYLPIMKLNTELEIGGGLTALASPEGSLVVAVDTPTEGKFGTTTGVAYGITGGQSYIRVEQGLDTREISPAFPLDNDLKENQYIIELDSRLGRISNKGGDNILEESFIDDDQVATYFVSSATSDFVGDIPHKLPLKKDAPFGIGSAGSEFVSGKQTVISGPRGTFLEFSVRASIDLNSSTYLFEKFGTTSATTIAGKTATAWAYIDSIIRVTGATTGYRLDIPVRFAKLITA